MTPARAPDMTYARATARARALMTLIVCALVMRALVPAGWMPVASAQGIRLALCDGTGPEAPVERALHAARASHAMKVTTARGRMAHVMTGMRHEQTPDHPASAPDHPCTFASVTPGIEAPALAAPLPPMRVTVVPARAQALVAVGRGLAAPPPPQTGPPTFA